MGNSKGKQIKEQYARQMFQNLEVGHDNLLGSFSVIKVLNQNADVFLLKVLDPRVYDEYTDIQTAIQKLGQESVHISSFYFVQENQQNKEFYDLAFEYGDPLNTFIHEEGTIWAYVDQVIDGMIFLESQGFHYPILSKQYILQTNKNVIKILNPYAFSDFMKEILQIYLNPQNTISNRRSYFLMHINRNIRELGIMIATLVSNCNEFQLKTDQTYAVKVIEAISSKFSKNLIILLRSLIQNQNQLKSFNDVKVMFNKLREGSAFDLTSSPNYQPNLFNSDNALPPTQTKLGPSQRSTFNQPVEQQLGSFKNETTLNSQTQIPPKLNQQASTSNRPRIFEDPPKKQFPLQPNAEYPQNRNEEQKKPSSVKQLVVPQNNQQFMGNPNTLQAPNVNSFGQMPQKNMNQNQMNPPNIAPGQMFSQNINPGQTLPQNNNQGLLNPKNQNPGQLPPSNLNNPPQSMTTINPIQQQPPNMNDLSQTQTSNKNSWQSQHSNTRQNPSHSQSPIRNTSNFQSEKTIKINSQTHLGFGPSNNLFGSEQENHSQFEQDKELQSNMTRIQSNSGPQKPNLLPISQTQQPILKASVQEGPFSSKEEIELKPQIVPELFNQNVKSDVVENRFEKFNEEPFEDLQEPLPLLNFDRKTSLNSEPIIHQNDNPGFLFVNSPQPQNISINSYLQRKEGGMSNDGKGVILRTQTGKGFFDLDYMSPTVSDAKANKDKQEKEFFFEEGLQPINGLQAFPPIQNKLPDDDQKFFKHDKNMPNERKELIDVKPVDVPVFKSDQLENKNTISANNIVNEPQPGNFFEQSKGPYLLQSPQSVNQTNPNYSQSGTNLNFQNNLGKSGPQQLSPKGQSTTGQNIQQPFANNSQQPFVPPVQSVSQPNQKQKLITKMMIKWLPVEGRYHKLAEYDDKTTEEIPMSEDEMAKFPSIPRTQSLSSQTKPIQSPTNQPVQPQYQSNQAFSAPDLTIDKNSHVVNYNIPAEMPAESFMANSSVFQNCLHFSLLPDASEHSILLFRSKPLQGNPKFFEVSKIVNRKDTLNASMYHQLDNTTLQNLNPMISKDVSTPLDLNVIKKTEYSKPINMETNPRFEKQAIPTVLSINSRVIRKV